MTLTIRPFCNTDPPRMWDVLRRSLSQAHPQSVGEMQDALLGFPYSSHQGVFVATEDDRFVGFLLAGPAPSREKTCLDPHCGIIRFVVIDPDVSDGVAVATLLVDAGERYLRGEGAQRIVAGLDHSCMPFFLGLFGLLEESSSPDHDSAVYHALVARGFRPHQKVHCFRMPLDSYRQRFSAKVVRQRSALDITFNDHPKPRHWWEACLMSYHQWLEATAYQHNAPRGDAALATLTTCVSIPRGTKSLYNASRRAGLIDVYVAPELRHQGVMSYLLGETLRFLANDCQVASVESYVAEEFSPMVDLLTKERWQTLPPRTLLVKEC